jgi:hypothetical protein
MVDLVFTQMHDILSDRVKVILQKVALENGLCQGAILLKRLICSDLKFGNQLTQRILILKGQS